MQCIDIPSPTSRTVDWCLWVSSIWSIVYVVYYNICCLLEHKRMLLYTCTACELHQLCCYISHGPSATDYKQQSIEPFKQLVRISFQHHNFNFCGKVTEPHSQTLIWLCMHVSLSCWLQCSWHLLYGSPSINIIHDIVSNPKWRLNRSVVCCMNFKYILLSRKFTIIYTQYIHSHNIMLKNIIGTLKQSMPSACT